MLDDRQTALVALGRALRASGYRFVTPTPETHRRVLERAPRPGPEDGSTSPQLLRDVFGWSRPFARSLLPDELRILCDAAGILTPVADGPLLKSRVRFSTLEAPDGHHLFVHSAYPTTAEDAVFFGPDSYRFASALLRTVRSARRLVDVGCGTGVGGLVLADRAAEVVLADVSARALDFAAVNRALASSPLRPDRVSLCRSDVLAEVTGDFDVIVSNPPYLVGPEMTDGGRLYRDGGGPLGLDLAIRIASQALERLVPGGRLILYTGVPIIEGRNVLADRLEPQLRAAASRWQWEELDPDVFGDELERPCYRTTERLAAVLLTAQAT
ncbi:MAG TPA: class I SAM-dependent methyltransferase [Polyangia bacterium]|jgi:SAM-dependent methyltransferase|nr:class I SAM-dependent methyltransferase [Polyangia bacterium]